MRFDGKQLAKLALIFFGLLFIVCLFLGRRQGQEEKPSQPEGERITVEDVEILLDALGISFPVSASDAEGQKQTDRQLSEEGENIYLTYGQYLALCESLAAEEWGLPDYRERYEPTQALLKEDWYRAFRIFLAYLDTESSIWETTVFVLKTDREKAEAYTENGAMQGACPYASTAFAESDLQELKVYVQGNTLLTIVEVLPEDHYLGSVWVMENKDGTLDCFYHQTVFQAALSADALKNPPEREQIADLTFRDGCIVEAKERREKIHGRLLRASAQELEIEDYGVYQVAEDMEVYKLYGSLRTLEQGELRVGCADTDFVVERGKVYACLVSEEAGADQIRVLLKNTAAGSNFHETVGILVDGERIRLRSDQMTVGERRTYRSANLTDKVMVEMEGSGRADHDYRGAIECLRMEQGIVLINELPLEEYLYAVVPSEMPASYPQEALKAQAVCARTYAYRYILRAGLPELGAHVDDTTAYQVYHNIEEHAAATTAVKETDGVLLTYEGEAAGNYYYSTSCGAGTDVVSWQGGNGEDIPYLHGVRVSEAYGEERSVGAEAGTDGGFEEDDAERKGVQPLDNGNGEMQETAAGASENFDTESLRDETVFRQFITTVHETDFEKDEPWYRWSYHVEELDEKNLFARLKERYASAPAFVLTKAEGDYYVSEPIGKTGKLKRIEITKRGAGGIAQELTIEAGKATYKVLSEYNIRYVLCDRESTVRKQDGSETVPGTLLPSGFFVLDTVVDTGKDGESVVGYTLTGGGFGHGVGMSQNGAKAMGEQGADYGQILSVFYPGCEVTDAEALREL
ncbi:MAG: SpoIID/LytB domain-containing protein [Lachnospiraceae bacterium]|nr:SpoIID/LytB domain-containing protein [Lachnospiraceae bacterium]